MSNNTEVGPMATKVKIGDTNVATTVTDMNGEGLTKYLEEIKSSYSSRRSKQPMFVVGVHADWSRNMTYDSSITKAILQLCVDDKCLIIQVKWSDAFHPMLLDLFDDPDIYFVGVGIGNVLSVLGFFCRNAIELGTLAADALNQPRLRVLNAVDLAHKVGLNNMNIKPSRDKVRNWNAMPLTQKQIRYATVDVYASFLIGKKLLCDA